MNEIQKRALVSPGLHTGGGGGGGETGAFCSGPQPERGPRRLPLNACLKDQYTLIEQSDLDLDTLIEQSQYSSEQSDLDLVTLIEQSQYSSEQQCSKLINEEIWLVRGSYCHC